MKFNCKICNKEFTRHGKQAKVAVCCSMKCLGEYKKAPNNVLCLECNKSFHLKPKRMKRVKNGNFCSIACFASWKSKNQFNEHNPNFRNRMYDNDGYRIIHSDTYGREKMHIAVCKEILKVEKLPLKHHVHHRDANHLNNDPSNLVILSLSDHQWLHKQFGNATLWAYMNNKVSLETLGEWSNDKEKTFRILPLDIYQQIGVFKQDELLESPTLERQKEDNQQPSLDSNIFEGSTTNTQVQTDNAEDSNGNTSVLPLI
jgi:hypothetical protein